MADNQNTIFARAIIKGIDNQPRKTRIVADLVRDRYVADAVIILENTPRRAARAVRKAIESAAANLINNSGVSIDPRSIRIARISVTAGTRIRRYMPASRGRALPFEKISSNIFVEVAGEPRKNQAKNDKTSTSKAALESSTAKSTAEKVKQAAPKAAEKEGK